MVLFRDDMAWINAVSTENAVLNVLLCLAQLNIILIGSGAQRWFLPHVFERS